MNRQLITLLVLTLFIASQTYAQQITDATLLTSKSATIQQSMEKVIFFNDPENGFYYVDFEAVGSKVVALSLQTETGIIFSEDVSTLPNNVIYEIDMNGLKTNTYTIELVTIEEDKILQEVEVKAKPVVEVGNGE